MPAGRHGRSLRIKDYRRYLEEKMARLEDGEPAGELPHPGRARRRSFKAGPDPDAGQTARFRRVKVKFGGPGINQEHAGNEAERRCDQRDKTTPEEQLLFALAVLAGDPAALKAFYSTNPPAEIELNRAGSDWRRPCSADR